MIANLGGQPGPASLLVAARRARSPASDRARGQEARSSLRVGCACLRNGQLFWGLDFGGDDDSLVLLAENYNRTVTGQLQSSQRTHKEFS